MTISGREVCADPRVPRYRGRTRGCLSWPERSQSREKDTTGGSLGAQVMSSSAPKTRRQIARLPRLRKDLPTPCSLPGALPFLFGMKIV